MPGNVARTSGALFELRCTTGSILKYEICLSSLVPSALRGPIEDYGFSGEPLFCSLFTLDQFGLNLAGMSRRNDHEGLIASVESIHKASV